MANEKKKNGQLVRLAVETGQIAAAVAAKGAESCDATRNINCCTGILSENGKVK